MEVTGEVHSPYMTQDETDDLTRNVGSVMLFDSLELGSSPAYSRDALGVISKRGVDTGH